MVRSDGVGGILQCFRGLSGKASLREQPLSQDMQELKEEHSRQRGQKYQQPERVLGMLESWQDGQDR